MVGFGFPEALQWIITESPLNASMSLGTWVQDGGTGNDYEFFISIFKCILNHYFDIHIIWIL